MSIEERRRHVAEAIQELEIAEAACGTTLRRTRFILEVEQRAADLPKDAITTEDRRLLQAIASTIYGLTADDVLLDALGAHEKRFGRLNEGA